MLKDSLPLLAEKRREEQENNLMDGEDSQMSGFESSSKKGSLEERITILSIAYHNLAVELEFLNQVRIQFLNFFLRSKLFLTFL